jgi:hypothetical protein
VLVKGTSAGVSASWRASRSLGLDWDWNWDQIGFWFLGSWRQKMPDGSFFGLDSCGNSKKNSHGETTTSAWFLSARLEPLLLRLCPLFPMENLVVPVLQCHRSPLVLLPWREQGSRIDSKIDASTRNRPIDFRGDLVVPETAVPSVINSCRPKSASESHSSWRRL